MALCVGGPRTLEQLAVAEASLALATDSVVYMLDVRGKKLAPLAAASSTVLSWLG
jgi:hypothetical protein